MGPLKLLKTAKSAAKGTPIERVPYIDKAYLAVRDALTPRSNQCINYAGYDAVVDPSHSSLYHDWNNSTYEQDVTVEIRQSLTSGDLAIDLGGYMGLHSLTMRSEVGDTGEVIVFEPHPKNVECIKQTIERNGFENVVLVPKAASDTNDTIEMLVDPRDGRTDGNTMLREDREHDESFTVETVSFNEFLSDFDRKVDLLKIDIEGAELNVIRDIRGRLDRIERMIIELHRNALSTDEINDIIDILYIQGEIHLIDSRDVVTTAEDLPNEGQAHVRWSQSSTDASS